MTGHTGIPLPPTAFAAAALLQRLAPKSTATLALRRVAAALLVAGSVSLMVGTLSAFRNHGTTMDPTAPEQTTVLVVAGTNSFSRNPMYVGLVGLFAAHASLRGSWQGWLPVAAFAATLDRFQIPHEEQALLEKFGADFENYCARRPRWLGKAKSQAGLSWQGRSAVRRTHFLPDPPKPPR